MKLYQTIGKLFELINACRETAERIDAELMVSAMKESLNGKFGQHSEAPRLWPGFYASEFREIIFHLNVSHKPFICVVEDWYMEWDRQAATGCKDPIINALYSLYCEKAREVVAFLKTDVPEPSSGF